MKRPVILILIFCSLNFLSGCAIGPLVSHETARTVGKSNHELIGGYGQAGYAFKWNYGVAENWDIGLHLESLSWGIRTKYAFLNSTTGWSVATALGTGLSIGGRHYYGDIIGSYLVDSWEPYGTLRLVHVTNDPVELRDKKTGTLDYTIDKFEYEYAQAIVGTRYWFSEHWLLSLEVSSLISITQGVKIGNSLIAGAAFGYRF